MTNTIDHLASNITLCCLAIEKFAQDANLGRLDNIEQLGARVDYTMEAILALREFVGELEQELMANIDHARALNSSI